jgi:hypothetical protein
MGLPGRSSWFPSAEVDGARDGSWRRHCFAWLYLVAKPSHVAVRSPRVWIFDVVLIVQVPV